MVREEEAGRRRHVDVPSCDIDEEREGRNGEGGNLGEGGFQWPPVHSSSSIVKCFLFRVCGMFLLEIKTTC